MFVIVCHRIMSLYVGTLTLFNMGIAMTAEYTAVGDLYATVINSARWPIVVIIGVVSIMYTAAGGLYVSIITDQWQVIPQLAFEHMNNITVV